MESVPWLAVTAAGGGWALFGSLAYLVITSIFSGRVISSREADAMQQRIDSQDKQIEDLTAMNNLLLREGLPTTNAVLDALRQAAEKQT
jgi:hypothetical protein